MRYEILAENIDFETFLLTYMDQHVELVQGVVIKMSPVTDKHDSITAFLRVFFDLYLEKTNSGVIKGDPFLVKLPGGNARQPDLFVVTTAHQEKIKTTYLDGAPDLIIEVVSRESSLRDRGDKFHEYEASGVSEYWIIDPIREETLFYVLDENGIYKHRAPDDQGFYTSVVLPQFKFKPAILLQNVIPRTSTAVALVNELLSSL